MSWGKREMLCAYPNARRKMVRYDVGVTLFGVVG